MNRLAEEFDELIWSLRNKSFNNFLSSRKLKIIMEFLELTLSKLSLESFAKLFKSIHPFLWF